MNLMQTFLSFKNVRILLNQQRSTCTGLAIIYGMEKTRTKALVFFSKKDNTIEKLNWMGVFSPSTSNSHTFSTEELELFLPCLINGEFQFLGIWTKAANSKAFRYIGQLWLYLQIHKKDLKKTKQIICGDFNSNSMWDSWDRWWNHSDVVKELSAIGIKSLYHTQSKEQQGKESQPTFYMHRNLEKKYHIDYSFVSEDLLSKSTVQILDAERWIQFSDHIPMEIIIKG